MKIYMDIISNKKLLSNVFLLASIGFVYRWLIIFIFLFADKTKKQLFIHKYRNFNQIEKVNEKKISSILL